MIDRKAERERKREDNKVYRTFDVYRYMTELWKCGVQKRGWRKLMTRGPTKGKKPNERNSIKRSKVRFE